jgi:hypothetical protein
MEDVCVGRRRRGCKGREGENRERGLKREKGAMGWWGGYEETGLRGVKTNGPSVQVKTWEKPQERTRDSSVVRVMLWMGEGGGAGDWGGDVLVGIDWNGGQIACALSAFYRGLREMYEGMILGVGSV